MKKVFIRAVASSLAFICVLAVAIICVSPKAEAASDNEKNIFYFLKTEMGLNDAAACGIVANIERESNFRPNLYGDGGTSYGICQWHNIRFENLKNFCSKKGYDYTTITGQLYYLEYELKKDYPDMIAKIKEVENTLEGAYTAGYIFCYEFERPANREYKAEQRGELAKEYWVQYGVLSDITPQTLNLSSSVSSKNDTTVTWQSGEGKYNRNRLHIVKQCGESLSYDWSNEQIFITSLYTLRYTFPKGSLNEGRYLMWVEPWHTTKQMAGPCSNFVFLEVTDEIVYSFEAQNDTSLFDASEGGAVEFYGWAVNTGGYQVEFMLSLDGGEAYSIEKTERNDIYGDEEYNSFCADAYCGFYEELLLSDLSNGEHSVIITAVSESAESVVADVTFTVVNGHDHSFTDFVYNDDSTYLCDGTRTAKCDLCNTRLTCIAEGTKLLLGVSSQFSAKARGEEVVLSWVNVEDAKGYRIYIYNSGWKLIGTTEELSYTVSNLENNTLYKFALKAYGLEGEESFLAPSYVTVQTCTTPSLPSSFTAVTTHNSVVLTWDKAQGATGYRIFEYNDETKKWDIISKAYHKTEYTVTDLEKATDYTFAVRPYCNTGEEIIWAYSYVKKSVTTKLPVPEIKAAHSSAAGRVTLCWSKSDGASGYQVWYSAEKDGTYVKKSNYCSRSNYIYGFESGSVIYVKVRAYTKIDSGYVYSNFTPIKEITIK